MDQLQIFGVSIFFQYQCKVETAIDSTLPCHFHSREKYAVYRTLPVFKSGTISADCLKCHFSILVSVEMVGFFDLFFYLGHV